MKLHADVCHTRALKTVPKLDATMYYRRYYRRYLQGKRRPDIHHPSLGQRWKKLKRDELEDAKQSLESKEKPERDFLKDTTEGHPLWFDSFVGIGSGVAREEGGSAAYIESALEGNKKRKHDTDHEHPDPQRLRYKMPRRHPPSTHAGPATYTKKKGVSNHHNGLGEKPWKGCKRYEWRETDQTALLDKDLHGHPIIKVPYNGIVTADAGRMSDRIYVKGVATHVTFRVKPGQTTLADPLTIRWAVICPDDNTGNVQVDVLDGTEFFRARGTAQVENIDFPTVGRYIEYHGNKINTDRYGIMRSGTFTMSPSSTGSDSYRHWDQVRMWNMWLPVKKDITFPTETIGDDIPNTNMYFIWWYTLRGDLNSAKTFSTQGPLEMQLQNVVYFKENLTK